MIFKLSVFAALVAPLVSAMTVSQPSQAVTSGGSMTITWQAQNGDPATFSVFLSNPTFNNVYGVANSVDTSLGKLTIAVPLVPENQQYTVQLVPIDNVNQILAESPPFTIGAATTSASTTASASTRSVTSTTLSVTASTGSVTTRVMPSSSSGFGVTVSNTQVSSAATQTAPISSGSAAAASSSAPVNNSAALPVRFDMNLGVVASMLLSVVAGAAVVAL